MAKAKDKKDSAIVEEYASKFRLYDDLAEMCKGLVEVLLEAEGLKDRIHSVSFRAKDAEKLREKCAGANKAGKPYSRLSDITDLSGVRVTTFFTDDVDRVGAMLEREFQIDPANSVDKRETLAPDSFGYLSVHYVCCLSRERSDLTENKRFAGVPVEIQVRSILQHAWAEIEHDLGYKSPAGVPAEARRRFSRLAGLLELADEEFKRLRDELNLYASDVARDIAIEPSNVQIDKPSLLAFLRHDTQASDLDKGIAKVLGDKLERALDPNYVEGHIPWLHAVGLESIEDLANAIKQQAPLVLKQVELQARRSDWKGHGYPLPRSISLYRLALVMLAETGGAEAIKDAFKTIESVRDNDPFSSIVAECTEEARSIVGGYLH